jgi:hypothetical protein
MIFDIIRYGTFTADDFITAQRSGDFSKFIQLPIDLRKKFVSDLIDKNPTQESKDFKQAAFDFLDGKIIEDQFRDAYWKYRAVATVATGTAAAVTASVAAGSVQAEYYRPHLEQYAKHLNKVIQEYE